MNVETLRVGDLVEPNDYAHKVFRFPKNIVLPWKVIRIINRDTPPAGIVVERYNRKTGKPYKDTWAEIFLQKVSVVQEKTEEKKL